MADWDVTSQTPAQRINDAWQAVKHEPASDQPDSFMGRMKTQAAEGWQMIKEAPGDTSILPTKLIRGAYDIATSPISAALGTAGAAIEKVVPQMGQARENQERAFGKTYTDIAGLPNAADILGTSAALVGGKPANITGRAQPAAIGSGALQAARNAGKVIEKIVSPETVDASAQTAVAAIREATGQAARDTAQTTAALEPAWKTVNAMPTQDRLNFLDYVEGRSAKYAGLEMKDPALQDLANTMKAAVEKRQNKLAAMPRTESMGFIQDYVSHAGLWKDPKKAQQFIAGGGKQGSSGFTKGRTIPTIADGINAGLEPTTTDPIALTLKYVTNADKYIAANEVFDTAKNAGTIEYHPPGEQPEGWVELKGRLANTGSNMTPYAPEGWARIYNNYISRGMAEHGPEFQQAYDAVRHTSNAITGLELGLSGYHALTMMQETMVNSVANAFGYAREPGLAGEIPKSIAKAVTAPVGYAMKGKKLQNIYLGLSQGSKEMEQITDLLTAAGGRGKGARHAPDYDFSTTGDYITAMKRGALRLQLAADRAEAMGSPLGSVKVAARHLGRIFDTVAAPIFQHYIPLIKNGAFFENMSAWLKAHPNASREEQVTAARQVWDSIDNRFGELVQDNIFTSKLLKQVGTIAMRSWSWTVGGDIRELGGAARDFARAPFKKPTGTGPNEGRWTQKMDYALALPIVYGTLAAVYQFFKTGKPPESPQDLLAPQTGGVDAATGEPERLIMPGYMKDLFGFYENPTQEAMNKRSTMVQSSSQLLQNQDWRGDPIFSSAENAPPWLQQFWNYASQNYGPISIRSLAQGRKEGSNLSGIEKMLGVRTAPRYLTDPEGYEQMMKSIHGNQWKTKERHDRAQQRLYE